MFQGTEGWSHTFLLISLLATVHWRLYWIYTDLRTPFKSKLSAWSLPQHYLHWWEPENNNSDRNDQVIHLWSICFVQGSYVQAYVSTGHLHNNPGETTLIPRLPIKRLKLAEVKKSAQELTPRHHTWCTLDMCASPTLEAHQGQDFSGCEPLATQCCPQPSRT